MDGGFGRQKAGGRRRRGSDEKGVQKIEVTTNHFYPENFAIIIFVVIINIINIINIIIKSY